MFEMMAAGLPVILCAKGESAGILNGTEGGPAGIALPPEDPEPLALAIRRFVSNPEAGKQMGSRGREYVFKHFDRKAIANEFEKSLLELMEK